MGSMLVRASSGNGSPMGRRRRSSSRRQWAASHAGSLGTYVSINHVLESIAEAMQQEMAPFGIKVQTVNPSAYLTGYNETMPNDVL
jgi:NAD(P)-dependent dehydrogenase (short-subunit alcohol dehydrogenase family)